MIRFSFGQDIHFSQYNASPLTLNPALTGFYNGDYRVVGNFRSQWGSFTDSYRTMSASFEISTLKGKLQGDYLSFGLLFYNDKAGVVEYSTNHTGFSMAYRKTLGSRVKHGLTFGIQGALVSQSINRDKLIFDNQYNGVEADPNISSGEVIASNNIQADLSTGLLWHIVPSKIFNIYFGAAYFHLTQPSNSFVDGSTNRLGAKYMGQVGAKIYLNRILNLLPSAVYWQQLAARQINAGTYLQFVLNDDYDLETSFSLGAWARIADPLVDAVIFGARMDFRGFVVGLSYDMNISKLSTVSDSRGAYEISMIYTGELVTRGKRNLLIPCPQL